jgi:hypothetical protein
LPHAPDAGEMQVSYMRLGPAGQTRKGDLYFEVTD